MRDITIVEGANELNVQLTPIVVAIAGSVYPYWIFYEGLADWEILDYSREIPLDKEIHLAPLWWNDSEISIVGHMDLLVVYPDGSEHTLSATVNQDEEAAPNNGWSVRFAPFIASQEGTYTVTATLSSAGQVLDSVTFTLISGPAVAVGMITLYMTGTPTQEWTAGWYYADRDTFLRNIEYYPPAGFETPWRRPSDPCTPPDPIDLSNLRVKIETYSEIHTCPLSGWKGSCRWGESGPFVVEDGGVYTIDVTTGVLSKR